MKIVINKCFGGFSLSPKAIKRLAELKGEKCYFFEDKYLDDNRKYIPISLEEACKNGFSIAFKVNNPDDYISWKNWNSMSSDERTAINKKYESIYLTSRPEDRTDPLLIKVIEELGDEASGSCAELRIVEIPDGIDYEIDEYDGLEHIAEVHRTWG